MDSQLTSSERKELRGKAHDLKPIVIIGKGLLTAGLIDEVGQALEYHELIKVKFIEGKDEKNELAQQLATETGSAVVGLIGNILILYKKLEESDTPRDRLL